MDNRVKINFFGIKLTFTPMWLKYTNGLHLVAKDKDKSIKRIRGLKTKFYGSYSTIEFLEKIPKMKNVVIHTGNNSKVIFGKTKYRIKNLYIDMRADNATLIIGDDFSCESAKIDFHGEPNLKVEIGNDCQFGCNIEIDPADGHTIYNQETNEPLNTPKNIKIGNHVWLCKNVSILKDVIIPDNCVVAKGSIVTSKFDKTNSVIAGAPAKVITSEKYQNINWTRTANRDFK